MMTQKISNKYGLRIVLIAVISVIVLLQVDAQKKQYIDGWILGGYDRLTHGIENTKVPGGPGYGIGGGFEYNLDEFIFLGGIEFVQLYSKTKLINYSESHDFVYPYLDNYYMTYNFEFVNFKERHSVGFLNIPLQAGLHLGERYYVLGGVKIGMNLFGKSTVKSTLRTTATDPMLIDDLSDIPLHNLGDAEYNEKNNLDPGMNIVPGLEFGVVLDDWLSRDFTQMNNRKKTRVSYRAGLFIDYGITNLNKAATTREVLSVPNDLTLSIPENGMPQSLDVTVNSLMSSTMATDKRFGSMFVGAKLTVSFDMTPKPKRKPVAKPKPKPVVKPEPKPVPVFYAHVVDADSAFNIEAEVLVSSMQDKKEVFRSNTDSNTGLASHELKTGKYLVHVETEGYLNYQEEYIQGEKPDTLLVKLQAIKKDVIVVLRNVFFELNSAAIRPESGPALEDLYQFLNKNPDVKIQIVGHTDNTGSAQYNQKLSEDRAKAIHDFLIIRGVNADRLSWLGKGSTNPVAPNDTEEGRAQNRRVEFVIR
ncbi:OmpA family protein [Saccharicrinis sp. FJH2]|uniref:OmpA family protein n=1 Tax=Saccharicrinis sp. FJH65 TaxID=3344659 RepID=UPI0035F3E70C